MRGATPDRILQAVRDYAAAEPGVLTLRGLEKAHDISYPQIYYHFPGGWYQILEKLGLSSRAARSPRIAEHDLLEDLHRRVRTLGRLPTWAELRDNAFGSPDAFRFRFGNVRTMRAAYETWRTQHRPTDPVVPLDHPRRSRRTTSRPTRSGYHAAPLGQPRPAAAWKQAPYGRPIAPAPILHAPTTELGVVHLFGALSASLGFAVLHIGPRFPDCEAVRRIGGHGEDQRWERVRIEFEFRSGNFLTHHHDPAACDLIVCWEHDWPDCPMEVLELRAVLEGLPATQPAVGAEPPPHVTAEREPIVPAAL